MYHIQKMDYLILIYYILSHLTMSHHRRIYMIYLNLSFEKLAN